MDIGSLVRDIGFPAVIALLLLYMMRELIKERKDMIDAETKRVEIAAQAQRADDDDRKQLIAMLGTYATSLNSHTEAIQKLVEASQQRTATVDKLIEQSAASLQTLETTIAGHVSERGQIAAAVTRNSEIINGVSEALQGVKSELANLRQAFDDTQSQGQIQKILELVDELNQRYKTKKDTDELAAVPTIKPPEPKEENSL